LVCCEPTSVIIVIGHTNNILHSAAIQAVGYVGRYSPLFISDGESIAEEQRPKQVLSKDNFTKRIVVYRLLKSLASPESRIIERAATALANLNLGERHGCFEEDSITGLYSVGKLKNEEVHFTVGEALSCIGAGWESTAAKDVYLDNSFPVAAEQNTQDTMKNILAQVLSVHLSKPGTRAAASIWLLSLVKFSGRHVSIQSKLPLIQTVFSYLLSDNNGINFGVLHLTNIEITQEVAAKGLTIVYDIGDDATKVLRRLVTF
jgi:proteasome component ECM29